MRGGTALADQVCGGELPGPEPDPEADRDPDRDRTSTHPTSVSNAIQATANQAPRTTRFSADEQRAYCSSKVVDTLVNTGMARMV